MVVANGPYNLLFPLSWVTLLLALQYQVTDWLETSAHIGLGVVCVFHCVFFCRLALLTALFAVSFCVSTYVSVCPGISLFIVGVVVYLCFCVSSFFLVCCCCCFVFLCFCASWFFLVCCCCCFMSAFVSVRPGFSLFVVVVLCLPMILCVLVFPCLFVVVVVLCLPLFLRVLVSPCLLLLFYVCLCFCVSWFLLVCCCCFMSAFVSACPGFSLFVVVCLFAWFFFFFKIIQRQVPAKDTVCFSVGWRC